MYLSPIIIFLGPWLLGSIATFYFSDYSVIFNNLSITGTWYLSLVGLFLFYSLVIFNIQRRRSLNLENIIKEKLNFNSLSSLIKLFVVLHFLTVILSILYSSGFPLYWVITGDPRTYVDYGIPTIFGLGNLLRAYGMVGCLILYLFGSKKQKRLAIYSSLYFIFTAFFLELSRGNGAVMLAHPLGFYFLIRKISFKNVSVVLLSALIFIPFFSFLQILRYGDFEFEKLNEQLLNAGISDASIINLVFTPAALYASTPIMNMDLNLKDAADFKFSPDKSITLLLPSFIRDFLAGDQSSPEKYGLLVSEAYNTTSFLTPLIQDFGRFGALFITFLFLSISGYIYSKAREGSLFYTLLWPPIFMSLLFSAFTLYFLALIVVLYPILVMFSYNFLLNKK